MLTVGTDSYVTVAEATSYIESNYLSTSPQISDWNQLAEADQEVVLRSACKQMEQLHYTGRKYVYNQILAFPRAGHTAPATVPQSVKDAQCELALEAISSTSQADKAEVEKRASMIRQGVTSFRVGNLSETYGKGSAQATSYLSQRVQTLLKPWTQGGYDIAYRIPEPRHHR